MYVEEYRDCLGVIACKCYTILNQREREREGGRERKRDKLQQNCTYLNMYILYIYEEGGVNMKI